MNRKRKGLSTVYNGLRDEQILALMWNFIPAKVLAESLILLALKALKAKGKGSRVKLKKPVTKSEANVADHLYTHHIASRVAKSTLKSLARRGFSNEEVKKYVMKRFHGREANIRRKITMKKK